MKKRKIDKKEVTWWVYLVILITLVIYGFWDSVAAELLLRAIKEAFSILIELAIYQPILTDYRQYWQ